MLARCPGNASGEQQAHMTYEGTRLRLGPKYTTSIHDFWNLSRGKWRTSIVAGEVIPVGKETDRHWEQGDDPSLLDFKLKEYRKTRLVVAETSDQRRWKKMGVRNLIRKSKLSQKAVYAILAGESVRAHTLAMLKGVVDNSKA